MSIASKVLPVDEYLYLIRQSELFLDIGEPPRTDIVSLKGNKEYTHAFYEYTKKKIKGLGKAKLYLLSLKPKMVDVQHYLRWHPRSKNSEGYREVLQIYESYLSTNRMLLERNKEMLPTLEAEVEMANYQNEYHRTKELPAVQAVKNFNTYVIKPQRKAQENALKILNDIMEKDYEDAVRLETKRIAVALDKNLSEEELEKEVQIRLRKSNFNVEFEKKMKDQYEEALREENAYINELLENKNTRINTNMYIAKHLLGMSNQRAENYVKGQRKERENDKQRRRQTFNQLRAEKQKRNQTRRNHK